MRLRHIRHEMALHTLREGPGPSLLLLHGMFGAGRDWQEAAAAWPGSVHALDFPGHGESEWLQGGAYAPEHLVASADIALQQIGPALVAGSGLGAYIALLLSGGRATDIPATLLLPGSGLNGAGDEPDHRRPLPDFAELARAKVPGGSDPLVASLELFWRPRRYAQIFATTARCLLLADDGEARPPWWEEARRSPTAQSVRGSTAEMLAELARHAER